GAYTAGLLVIPATDKAILQPALPKFIAHAHYGSVAATVIGGLLAAAVAAVLAVPLMRLNGIAAGLATFAVLVIVRTVANSWPERPAAPFVTWVQLFATGLATFPVPVIVRPVANSWTQVTNGAAGLSGLPVTTSKNDALVWALIAIVAGFAFQSTGLGLKLRGSREDFIAARSLGVSVRWERRAAWVVSAFLVGIG